MYELFASEIRVRAVLSRNGEEYASAITVFTQPTTKDLSLDVSSSLTHCGLMTTYGGRDLGQHWFR